MTAISTGSLNDGKKGWRIALCHALGDVAQSEQLKPSSRKENIKKKLEYEPLPLFDFLDTED